jgi:putative endonuclease
MAWVYMLQCADGTYYVGSTTDLEARLFQHGGGEDGAVYTRGRRPVKLVFAQECDDVAEAFALEKQYQGWSRKKREALINADYASLAELSRCYADRVQGG